MKKLVSILLVALMVFSIMLFTGCSSSSGGGIKTGLGHVISIDSSKDATADADGVAQADVVMAAVSVDSKGKIVSVTIDTAQTTISFNAQGKITEDLKAEKETKVELGPKYGMIKRSGIGKEWYEQIAELEKWMTGKTIDQIKAMKVKAVDENHQSVPDEPDLTSKVTISVEDYIAAVEEAVKNAK